MKNAFKMYYWKIISGQSQDFISNVIRGGLYLLSFVYFLLWLLRNLTRPFMGVRFNNKVISIGNITMGGVGKTPFVIYLIKELIKQGAFPIVVTRGYMASKDVPSDEGMMMKEILKSVPIFIGRKRVKNIKEAQRLYQQKEKLTFVMDDGFQHWNVKRDIDIVLLDARNPFGNKCLIPAGILREPLSALKRAQFFVLTHADDQQQVPDLEQQLKKINKEAFIIRTMHSLTTITKLSTQETFKATSFLGEKVALCSAIAQPASFQEAVAGIGAVIEYKKFFLDHYDYPQEQIVLLLEEIKARGISKVFITHKDAVKLEKYISLFRGIDVFVFHIEIKVIYGETEFISRLSRLLAS